MFKFQKSIPNTAFLKINRRLEKEQIIEKEDFLYLLYFKKLAAFTEQVSPPTTISQLSANLLLGSKANLSAINRTSRL